MPDLQLGDFGVASEDGEEFYVFNNAGRHLRTLEVLTRSTKLQFAYDSSGRLASITDPYGNTTTIEQSASGDPTGIVAPGTQRTTLQTNAGFLSAITNPAAESVQLTYTLTGLLQTLRDAKGNVHRFEYDGLGG